MLLLHTVKFKVKTYQQSSWSALNLHLRKKPKVFHLYVDDSRGGESPASFIRCFSVIESECGGYL